MKQIRIFISILIMLLWSGTATSQTVVNFDFHTCVNPNYMGNGAQWDPYQMDYGHGRIDISESDWSKIYHRLDFMRPQLMRVMINTKDLITDGRLVKERDFDRLKPILDYCQQHDVTVIFGDWGWGMADAKSKTFDRQKIELAADYVTWLVKEKSYSCIKYYNLINEPNGDWSVTMGNYDLWRDITQCFYSRLKKNKMLGNIQLVGADVAIWTTAEVPWLQKASTDLQLGLYDIHTYPSKITVNSGEYTRIIQAYKDAVPAGKQIVMGEVGLKFVEPSDSLYQQENLRRAAARPYASMDDSQMFIFDYMYGADMADILMQTANAGYSGCIAWMLDDAMHSAEQPDKLKMWGFWNILGDEFFGSDQEHIRPWFYAWSLLTRYMPKGSAVYRSTVTGHASVKALAVKKEDKYMLALLNVSKKPQQVSLQSDIVIPGCKRYDYAEGRLQFSDTRILDPNVTNLPLDLKEGIDLSLPGESLIVLTNFNE